MMSSATASDAEHALECELAAEALRSSGTLRLQVTGWSMLPSIWPGDTLIVDRADASGVSEGDIVFFARDRRLFAHRTKSRRVGNAQLVTRGDAMPSADLPVSESEPLGKVSRIQRNRQWIELSRTLRLTERAVAALVRSSDAAARVVVGMHGLQQTA